MSKTVKVLIDGVETEVEAANLTLLLHKDVMQIEVPDRFEINPRNTLELIRSLKQNEWEHLSTGEIFQFLFRKVFPLPEDSFHPTEQVIEVPEQLEVLQRGDLGVQHVSGLIIHAMEQGGILGKQLYFKMPESYLYPSYQANLGDFFMVLQNVLDILQDETANPKKDNPLVGWLKDA